MKREVIEWLEEPVEGGVDHEMEWIDDQTFRLEKSTEDGVFAEIFTFEYAAKIAEPADTDPQLDED